MALWRNWHTHRVEIAGPLYTDIVGSNPTEGTKMYTCDNCWVDLEETDITIRLAEDKDGWNTALLICEYCEEDYEWLEATEW